MTKLKIIKNKNMKIIEKYYAKNRKNIMMRIVIRSSKNKLNIKNIEITQL